MKVLWLASWYPNQTDLFTGDFIERHALAVAPHVQWLAVIAVVKDVSMHAGEVTITEEVSGNRMVYKASYGPSGMGAFVEKLLSQKKYLALQQKIFDKIKTAHGLPDILHVHVAMKAGLFAKKIWSRYHIPYVVTEHWTGYYKNCVPNIYSKGKLFVRLNNKVLAAARMLLPVSNDLGKTINQNFVKKDYQVIPNVVDTKLFFYKPAVAEIFQFIHPSYMNYQKNPEGILRACKIVKDKGQPFKMQMVGNDAEELHAQARQLGLLNTEVFFTPAVAYTQVAALMQQSQALVLFSRFENLPCVILEALCCGLPVISSRAGGVAEVIHADNGILVESENVQQLSNAMLELIQHYKNYNRDKIAASATATFNYETVGTQISQVYTNVLNALNNHA